MFRIESKPNRLNSFEIPKSTLFLSIFIKSSCSEVFSKNRSSFSISYRTHPADLFYIFVFKHIFTQLKFKQNRKPNVSFVRNKLRSKLGFRHYFGTQIVERHLVRFSALECQLNFIPHAYGQVAQFEFIQIIEYVTC